MRPPRPHCPNPACEHHRTPSAGFYAKDGYRPVAHGKPIPRYKCRECGTRFSSTSATTRQGQHRPDLNRKIFSLAVSGVSMTRMARLLGCSPHTVERKIRLLAIQAQQQHAVFLHHTQTAYAMMDELHTFIHARWAQVVVPVVIRAKTGHILSFGVARIPSTMAKGKAQGWTLDERNKVMMKTLAQARMAMKPGATLATDKATVYSKHIAQALPGVKHQSHLSASHNPTGYNPLFAVDHLFAKMRNDLARLGRKTWITTKTQAALERHLWLYVAWVNGYRMR